MPATPMLTLLAEDHHWWFASRTRAILAYLDRHLGPGQERTILDVGCGAANMAHHLGHFGRVIGVDNNARPLAVARTRGLAACLGRAESLPFPDETFHLVALLDTVEHVPEEERVFAECWRVLRSARPGRHEQAGRLLVTVPAFMWLWSQNDVINLHQRRYTVAGLRARLTRHGFRVIRISYNNFFVFPLAAALIWLRRGRAEPRLASPHHDPDAYQVEMEPAPPLVNALLTLVGRLEAALLRHLSLPVGTSIIAIAEKAGPCPALDD